MFTLAECEAAWGKVATALEHYRAFVEGLSAMPSSARGRYDERRTIALGQISSLGRRVPRVTVELDASAPKDVVVKRDGVLIDARRYGVAQATDPGEHTFIGESAGRVVFEQTVTLVAGGHAQVRVRLSEAEAPAAPRVAYENTVVEKEQGLASNPTTWFYAGIGLGGLGLATGVIAGGVALAKKGTIEDHCAASRCDAAGINAVHSGQRAAAFSSAGFGIAVVGAAVAITFGLLRRSARRSNNAASQQRGVAVEGLRSLTFKGTF